MKNIIRTSVYLAMAAAALGSASASATTLKQAIADAISARVPAPGRYEVTLATSDITLDERISLQNGRKLERLNYNPANQAFQATFVYRNDLGNEERLALAGTAWAVIAVPALVQDVTTGDTISSASLGTIEVPASRTTASMITAPDMVVGQIARRPVRANTPLFAMDFAKPVMVRKGDTVTIVAEMPGIRISAQGKAMTNGSKGDVITFMNTSSRRSVDARIVDSGTAVITAPAQTASIN
jgi:flagella basal body P-ring formation protein FlgA